MQKQTLWVLAFVSCSLFLVVLACEANAVNMAIGGTPSYICPSSTPIPTNTPLPPDPPTYPSAFAANLDYYYVDPSRNFVEVLYMAQNVGTVRLWFSGTNSDGTYWSGSGGSLPIAYTYPTAPGIMSAFGVFIPPSVNTANIFISSNWGAWGFTVTRYAWPQPGSPSGFPCCLPGPIYPTPRPTYTPYPTPTLYAIPPYNNGYYFLDDPVYNYMPPIQLRLKMLSPIKSGSFTIPFLGVGWTAASWTVQITNVGAKEYDFLGAGYTYVSEVSTASGAQAGVWSPSHLAAQFLGVIEQAYGPRAVMPGQSITITVAAWIPVNSTASKVSLNLDPYHAGDPGWATFTPGQGRLATWINQTNTVCKGEIAYP